MDILKIMKKNIVKFSFCFVLLAVLCTFATTVASAKTVSNSVYFAEDTRLDYFKELFNRNDYKYSLLVVDNVSSGYNYYYDYYFCLTNDEIDVSNSINVKTNCNEMYRYYRNSNNDYKLEKINDNKLEINNSVYYYETKKDFSYYYLCFVVFISICLVTLLLFIVFYFVLGG